METPKTALDRLTAFVRAREKHCDEGGNLDPERIISFGADGVVHHVTSADLAEVLRLAKMGAKAVRMDALFDSDDYDTETGHEWGEGYTDALTEILAAGS